MKTINLKAKSSTSEYYQIIFEISESIKVSCNCNAGVFGKLCKHKFGLLSGDRNFLFDLNEESIFNELINVVKKSDFLKLSNELQSAKKDIDIAKQHESKIKKKIELLFKSGIPLNL